MSVWRSDVERRCGKATKPTAADCGQPWCELLKLQTQSTFMDDLQANLHESRTSVASHPHQTSTRRRGNATLLRLSLTMRLLLLTLALVRGLHVSVPCTPAATQRHRRSFILCQKLDEHPEASNQGKPSYSKEAILHDLGDPLGVPIERLRAMVGEAVQGEVMRPAGLNEPGVPPPAPPAAVEPPQFVQPPSAAVEPPQYVQPPFVAPQPAPQAQAAPIPLDEAPHVAPPACPPPLAAHAVPPPTVAPPAVAPPTVAPPPHGAAGAASEGMLQREASDGGAVHLESHRYRSAIDDACAEFVCPLTQVRSHPSSTDLTRSQPISPDLTRSHPISTNLIRARVPARPRSHCRSTRCTRRTARCMSGAPSALGSRSTRAAR